MKKKTRETSSFSITWSEIRQRLTFSCTKSKASRTDGLCGLERRKWRKQRGLFHSLPPRFRSGKQGKCERGAFSASLPLVFRPLPREGRRRSRMGTFFIKCAERRNEDILTRQISQEMDGGEETFIVEAAARPSSNCHFRRRRRSPFFVAFPPPAHPPCQKRRRIKKKKYAAAGGGGC